MAKKGKTTIMVLDKNQNSIIKPFQIPTNFLHHWKKYLLGIVGTFVIMFAAIIYLMLQPSSKQNISQPILVKNNTPTIQNNNGAEKVDTSVLKSNLSAINDKLASINKYLKLRGIKPIFNKIKEQFSSSSVNQITQDYNQNLNATLAQIVATPLGFPVDGRITSGFGGRSNPFSGHGGETHKGIDLSGERGESVKSTASGRVKFAGVQHGYGNVIIVSHTNGFETKYAHLSKILVKNGEQVQPGEEIGKVGSTGRSTGPHLHYEVLRNGIQINPRSFLTIE